MHKVTGSIFLLSLALQSLEAETFEVTDKTFHLGTKGVPEWNEFAKLNPDGRNLSLDFEAKRYSEEATLFIRQDDVKAAWRLSINGKKIGDLERFESKVLHTLKVPPGTLRDGENKLNLAAPVSAIDNIFVGEAFIETSSASTALSRSFLKVRVTDGNGNKPLPCRITITDLKDYLMPLQVKPSLRVAVRPGVVYSLDGTVEAGVLPGEYVVYASRGFEYGVAFQRVSVKKGETKPVNLSIEREVPTKGWISCDPHIHVRTYSGHGDSTIEERIPTIAGEGVELPVATDHNHHADYQPFQRSAKATAFFTPVIGNEVTTKVGHFNVFPIEKGAATPNHKAESWPELFRSMRSTPGVEIILLNHPRNVHSNFSPTDPAHFNPVTGSSKREGGFAMDAIEVITSAALQTDHLGPFRDWFALLNSGLRITAAGSSDTHDVNRYILGQGRTYLRCPDNNPAALDVAAACRSLREGRALVSMGLLTTIKVNDRFEVGDLATKLPTEITVEIEVLGPRWADADQLTLYANGIPIWEKKLDPSPNKVRKALARRVMPRPGHDLYLVAMATGPGVTKPYWEIPRPYQHKNKEYAPRVIGATNPVWIDSDGDGKHTSPRAYAERITREKENLETILKKLSSFDQSVSAQAAELLAKQGIDLSDPKAKAAFSQAAPAVSRGFASFLETVK
ncbi:MAG: hypothetical protein CMI31_14320 [Opitutae bacterium]|nr:hypothetical protein [Opitutae bacterium]